MLNDYIKDVTVNSIPNVLKRLNDTIEVFKTKHDLAIQKRKHFKFPQNKPH